MGIIVNSELYPWVSLSAISSILYTRLRCTEDVAYHRMWVAGLFQLQHRVLPALVFARVGKGLELERGSTSPIQSRMSESVRNIRDCLETRTDSEPAKRSLVSPMCLIHGYSDSP